MYFISTTPKSFLRPNDSPSAIWTKNEIIFRLTLSFPDFRTWFGRALKIISQHRHLLCWAICTHSKPLRVPLSSTNPSRVKADSTYYSTPPVSSVSNPWSRLKIPAWMEYQHPGTRVPRGLCVLPDSMKWNEERKSYDASRNGTMFGLCKSELCASYF